MERSAGPQALAIKSIRLCKSFRCFSRDTRPEHNNRKVFKGPTGPTASAAAGWEPGAVLGSYSWGSAEGLIPLKIQQ